MKEQRKVFVKGCCENGLEKKQAEEIYDLIVKFADYGFNKSHSAAYGLVAYYTAYLKANYALEFMAATLGGAMANSDKVAFYIDHCRRIGFEVLPPDINESGVSFTVVGNKIRFGIGAIKNVGSAAVEQLLAERENGLFVSLADFCTRMNGRCNKRMLEYMIKGGCMDTLPGHRAQKLAAMDELLARSARLHKQKISGQMDIFDVLGEPEPVDELPPMAPMEARDLLKAEKEALGMYISGHPLEDYTELLDALNVSPIPSLDESQEGKEVTVAGMVAACRTTLTRRGKRMAFLTLEDQFSSLEVIIFDQELAQAHDLLKGENPLLVKGRLEFPTQGEAKIMAESITKLVAPTADEKLYLKLSDKDDSDCINRVLFVLDQFPGEIPVYLYFPETKALRLMERFPVNINERLLGQLYEMLGQDCVVLKTVDKQTVAE